jgi:hypothetical protein
MIFTPTFRPPRRRRFSPGDALRLLIGIGLTFAGLLLMSVGQRTMRGFEADVASGLARLPNRLEDGLLAVARPGWVLFTWMQRQGEL